MIDITNLITSGGVDEALTELENTNKEQNTYKLDEEVFTGKYWINGKKIYRLTTKAADDLSMSYVDEVISINTVGVNAITNQIRGNVDNFDNIRWTVCQSAFTSDKIWIVDMETFSLLHRTIEYTKITE